MFGIGGFELFLILLFGFLVFGPDKLPALAKTVGQAIAKFRDAQAEMTEQLKLDELLKGADAKGARKAPAAKATDAAGGGASVAKAGAEGAQGAAAAASPAGAAGAPGASSAEGERLSFSERKARYEAERAAQVAAKQDSEGGDA